MQQALASTDVSVLVEFKLNGEFVVPDAGSIKLTLRSNSGAIVTGYDHVAQADTEINAVAYVIPAAKNALGGSARFEMRYVTLDFTYNAAPGAVQAPYRLTPFVPLQVGPQDVREALGGLALQELPDQAIDLFESYLVMSIGQTNFEVALITAGLASTYANRAVVLTEAIRLVPGLQARILKKEELNNGSTTRADVDFEQLSEDLQNLLQKTLEAMNSLVAGIPVVAVASVNFLVSAPTDPVTNA